MIAERIKASRVAAKFFFDEDVVVELPRIVPVFHRWIQEGAVPGLLIDVADYKHVHEGPGVMLIGHEGDYVIDLGQGRPGVLYQAKRAWPEALAQTVPARLALVLRLALTAAARLEEERGGALRSRRNAERRIEERLRVRGDQFVLQFADRLHTPNRPEVVAQLRDELAPLLEVLYSGLEPQVTWVNEDPRRLLTLEVRAPGALGVKALLQRLEEVRVGEALEGVGV